MTDYARLLHNMSTPPSTVVNYAGLSALANSAKSDHEAGKSVGDVRNADTCVFGIFIAFRLPLQFPHSSASILACLGEKVERNPEKILRQLIEKRAGELPIPDGCVVKPCERGHPCPWPDPLAALAIITKSSTNVWLRSKAPRTSAIRKRTAVSLLLPPANASRLKEVPE